MHDIVLHTQKFILKKPFDVEAEINQILQREFSGNQQNDLNKIGLIMYSPQDMVSCHFEL